MNPQDIFAKLNTGNDRELAAEVAAMIRRGKDGKGKVADDI